MASVKMSILLSVFFHFWGVRKGSWDTSPLILKYLMGKIDAFRHITFRCLANQPNPVKLQDLSVSIY